MNGKVIAGSFVGLALVIAGAVVAARMSGRSDDPMRLASRAGTAEALAPAIQSDAQSDPGLQIAKGGPEATLSASEPMISDRPTDSIAGSPMRARRELKFDLPTEFDTDGDGVISESERKAADEHFRAEREARRQQWLLEQYDKDGDGVLSAEELAQQEQDRQDRETRRAERAAEREQKALAAYDSDGDGVLSDEEKQAGRQARSAYMQQQHQAMPKLFDSDQNGQMDTDENTAMPDAIGQFFADLHFVRVFDSNGDNAITPEDMPAYMDLFAAGDLRADLDHNGVVDASDVAQFHQRALMPTDPRMAEAMAWFNNAPPPVDPGLANIMVFGAGAGGDFVFGGMEAGAITFTGGGGEIVLDAVLPDVDLEGGSAVIFIQTVETEGEEDGQGDN